jgi:hypothetical protein
LLEGVKSDWTYLNEPLSWLYGLAEVSGHELRKVMLARRQSSRRIPDPVEHSQSHCRWRKNLAHHSRELDQ